eukprot:3307742-Pyramimonas_sp.AAC.1
MLPNTNDTVTKRETVIPHREQTSHCVTKARQFHLRWSTSGAVEFKSDDMNVNFKSSLRENNYLAGRCGTMNSYSVLHADNVLGSSVSGNISWGENPAVMKVELDSVFQVHCQRCLRSDDVGIDRGSCFW